jgi:trehalose-6-phosphate synthase
MNFPGPSNGRLIIVSNRLPFTVHLKNDEIHFDESTGGLVTGISTFLDSYDSYKYHLARMAGQSHT